MTKHDPMVYGDKFSEDFRYLNWRYCTLYTVCIYLYIEYRAIFWGYIPLHRPKIYGSSNDFSSPESWRMEALDSSAVRTCDRTKFSLSGTCVESS
jgi:hypothetical protein